MEIAKLIYRDLNKNKEIEETCFCLMQHNDQVGVIIINETIDMIKEFGWNEEFFIWHGKIQDFENDQIDENDDYYVELHTIRKLYLDNISCSDLSVTQQIIETDAFRAYEMEKLKIIAVEHGHMEETHFYDVYFNKDLDKIAIIRSTSNPSCNDISDNLLRFDWKNGNAYWYGTSNEFYKICIKNNDLNGYRQRNVRDYDYRLISQMYEKYIEWYNIQFIKQ